MILTKLIKNFKHLITSAALFVFIIYSCIFDVNANWVHAAGQQLNLPGHLYKINCTKGELLAINAPWLLSAGRDLFIYKQNANLLSNNYVAYSTSYAASGENMTYYVNSTATYYVRVKSYNIYSLDFLDYKINIASSLGANYEYSATISDYNKYMPAVPFTKASTNGCALKI